MTIIPPTLPRVAYCAALLWPLVVFSGCSTGKMLDGAKEHAAGAVERMSPSGGQAVATARAQVDAIALSPIAGAGALAVIVGAALMAFKMRGLGLSVLLGGVGMIVGASLFESYKHEIAIASAAFLIFWLGWSARRTVRTSYEKEFTKIKTPVPS